jgi:hypothetical protein
MRFEKHVGRNFFKIVFENVQAILGAFFSNKIGT